MSDDPYSYPVAQEVIAFDAPVRVDGAKAWNCGPEEADAVSVGPSHRGDDEHWMPGQTMRVRMIEKREG